MRVRDTVDTMPAIRMSYDVIHETFLNDGHNALIRADLKDAQPQPNRLLAIRGMSREVEALQDADHPRGVIYLDGACRGPYMDARRKIYSLDHHENCIRPITLATCVQALRLTRARVIQAFGYQVIANEPDLDTILAAWAIMHADRMAYDDAVFRKVRPLFTVAGNTDAYGFDHDDFLDLSAERIAEIRGRILWLTQRERRLRGQGRWGTTDFLEHMEKVFRRLDEYAFYSGGIDELTSIEADETMSLPNGETIIFAQASMGGVYGAERELIKSRKDDKCIAIIFHDGKTKWTIKLTQMVSRYDLAPLWRILSRAESEAKQRENVKDQRLLRVGWGGASGIGGEPRYHSGRAPFIGGDVITHLVFEELKRQQEAFSKTPAPVPAESEAG